MLAIFKTLTKGHLEDQKNPIEIIIEHEWCGSYRIFQLLSAV